MGMHMTMAWESIAFFILNRLYFKGWKLSSDQEFFFLGTASAGPSGLGAR